MSADLNELWPVQFIEGINDKWQGDIDITHELLVNDYEKIGLRYVPRFHLLLEHFETYIYSDPNRELPETSISICLSHGNNPEYQPLTEFKPTTKIRVTVNSSHRWQRFEVSPVILRSGQLYWIIIEPNQGHWALDYHGPISGSATTEYMVMKEGTWGYAKPQRLPFLLRFYGRLIPLYTR